MRDETSPIPGPKLQTSRRGNNTPTHACLCYLLYIVLYTHIYHKCYATRIHSMCINLLLKQNNKQQQAVRIR